MNQYLGIFNGVMVAGVVQALAASWFIGHRKEKSSSTKILRALLLVLGLLACKMLLHTIGGWQLQGLRYFPLAIDTLIQPLFYLYACSLTDKAFNLSHQQWPHFALPAIFLTHALVVYLVTLGYSDNTSKDLVADYLAYNAVKWCEDVVALIAAVLYWVLCWTKVQRYRQWLFAHESASRYQEFAWLRNLLIVSAILVLLLAVSSLAANIFHWSGSFYYLVVFYVYLIVLIYFLSFRGASWGYPSDVPVVPDLPVPVEQVELPAPLTQPDQQLQQLLLQVMREQQPYLDPNLNLAGLAALTGIPAAQLSALINSGLGQNFRNWVNSYRVEEVKKRLADPAFAHLNMTGIAFDCGFNSEASFYRIFRQFTGQSPKSYLAIQKGK